MSKLFVGGLSWNTDDYSLKEGFSAHGEVVDAIVIKDRETGKLFFSALFFPIFFFFSLFFLVFFIDDKMIGDKIQDIFYAINHLFVILKDRIYCGRE
jgi:hypothetical protein